MKVYILDASAMLAYLMSEPGADLVTQILTDNNSLCYAHSINLCEVYYNTLRTSTPELSLQSILTLFDDGVIEQDNISRPFWQKVGEVKSRGRISIADCFTIVLAQELNGEVVTSDHHEYDAIVPLGIVPIRFIR